MKGQPALEFLTIYSWSIVAVILFMVVATVLATAQSKQIYPPSHCYITPSMPCYGMYIMSNSTGNMALVIFTNELGTSMSFPSNSFLVKPTFANSTFYGSCAPSSALSGNFVYCKANLTGFYTTLGTELNPNFQIGYRICTACSNSLPIYNTSGSALLTVSPYSSAVAGLP